MNFRAIVHLAIYLLGAHNASGGFLTFHFQGSLGGILGMVMVFLFGRLVWNQKFRTRSLKAGATLQIQLVPGMNAFTVQTLHNHTGYGYNTPLAKRLAKPFADFRDRSNSCVHIRKFIRYEKVLHAFGAQKITPLSVAWVLIDTGTRSSRSLPPAAKSWNGSQFLAFSGKSWARHIIWRGVLYFFNGLVFEHLHQKQWGGIFPWNIGFPVKFPSWGLRVLSDGKTIPPRQGEYSATIHADWLIVCTGTSLEHAFFTAGRL